LSAREDLGLLESTETSILEMILHPKLGCPDNKYRWLISVHWVGVACWQLGVVVLCRCWWATSSEWRVWLTRSSRSWSLCRVPCPGRTRCSVLSPSWWVFSEYAPATVQGLWSCYLWGVLLVGHILYTFG